MKRKNEPLTEEQRAYIIAHINDRPRLKVAQAAGVCMASVYRIVREQGGQLDYTRDRANPEWVRIVRENYATMSGHDIERKYGITRNRANKIAKRLGLRHNAETTERMRRELRARFMDNLAKIDQAAKTKRWLLTRRMDELRVFSGKPQKTRFRFTMMTTGAYKAKHHLIHKYGYYACEGEPYTLLYDGETRRMERRGVRTGEEYYETKYKLRFERYGTEEHQPSQRADTTDRSDRGRQEAAGRH